MEVGESGSLDVAAVRRALQQSPPDLSISPTAHFRAAVAIVLCECESSSREVLLIRRAVHHLDPWSGHMAFPGGRQEPEDATLEETARRETLEELGLQLDSSMLLGRLSDVHAGRHRTHSMSVSPFIYSIPPNSRNLPLRLSEEVAAAHWLPLRDLLNAENICAYCPTEPSQRPLYPSFQLNGCTIWGLTYRMLCNFARIMGRHLMDEEEFEANQE